MEKLVKHLKGRFITGLFVVVPLGITIFILKFLFNFADGIFGSYLDSLLSAFIQTHSHIPGLGMLTGFVVIYVLGVLATNVIGTRVIRWWDGLLSRIPLVKWIYGSSKQLTQVFKDSKTSYRRSVFVEYPRIGVLAVGFVTSEVERDGEKLLVVYLPTTPNPTSGFALFFKESEVHDSGMSVEEAVKFIVSGGAMVPREGRL